MGSFPVVGQAVFIGILWCGLSSKSRSISTDVGLVSLASRPGLSFSNHASAGRVMRKSTSRLKNAAVGLLGRLDISDVQPAKFAQIVHRWSWRTIAFIGDTAFDGKHVVSYRDRSFASIRAQFEVAVGDLQPLAGGTPSLLRVRIVVDDVVDRLDVRLLSREWIAFAVVSEQAMLDRNLSGSRVQSAVIMPLSVVRKVIVVRLLLARLVKARPLDRDSVDVAG